MLHLNSQIEQLSIGQPSNDPIMPCLDETASLKELATGTSLLSMLTVCFSRDQTGVFEDINLMEFFNFFSHSRYVSELLQNVESKDLIQEIYFHTDRNVILPY